MTASLSLSAVAFIFVAALPIQAVTAAAYLDHVFDNGTKRVKRKITWEPAAYEPVPISKEIQLLQKNVLIRPGEFGHLHSLT